MPSDEEQFDHPCRLPEGVADEQIQRLATLGVLAGSIAHEVNNLLTPVLSYAQLALQNPDDRELTAKALTKSAAGAEKAGHIMSSLLGFVRSDTESRATDVTTCIEEALGCIGCNLEREGIEVSPMALQQVLLNLLLNARDAIQDGSGTLTIRAKRSTWNNPNHPDNHTDSVEISIEDTGCGMDSEMLENAFLPFVTRRHNTRNGSGTGLGLPICKQLVEEVGGRIAASSAPNAGTRFDVMLEEFVADSVEQINRAA